MLNDVQELKLSILTEGIRVSEPAKQKLGQHDRRPLTLSDYATTSGITLALPDDIWVNAPVAEFNPNFVRHPRIELAYQERYYLVSNGRHVNVRPIPVPNYHNKTNSSGERHTDYAITHADRVRISPIEGCSMACTFCDIPFTTQYRRRRIDGIVDAIHAAVGDSRVPAKHILISGGTPGTEDFDYLQSVFQTVARNFPQLSVDIMMVPVPGLLDIQQLADSGINGLAINLELYSDDAATRTMPAKRRIGRSQYLDFIEDAVVVFGIGKVRSLLLVGLEPLEETLKGVAALVRRGCDPVLSPFRPDPATPLRDHPAPSVALLKEAYLRSMEIVSKSDNLLGPRCIPCQHNTLTFPSRDEGYFFS